MAIKTKVLKKQGRKLVRAGAAGLQSGAATTARVARSTATRAKVAAGAAGALAVMGAGFALAMRDLELRGAGNLLGTQQSGHIATVGYEMYCALLERAVRLVRPGGRNA